LILLSAESEEKEIFMLKIGIIIGSTRPGRVGDSVAKWFYDCAIKKGGAEFELVDLADYNLPLYDEPNPPALQKYTQDHTKKWSAKIASLDAFIFVTPEYNHSTSGALKNALDFLMNEWANKAAGFVGYGGALGARAVEHLRLILAELRVATVRTQVGLSLFADFEKFKNFNPGPQHQRNVNALLDEVIAWGEALRPLRKQ
jgi:NAD(P)H-dependent FMN reductase